MLEIRQTVGVYSPPKIQRFWDEVKEQVTELIKGSRGQTESIENGRELGEVFGESYLPNHLDDCDSFLVISVFPIRRLHQ